MLKPVFMGFTLFVSSQVIAGEVSEDTRLLDPLNVTGAVSTFGATKSDSPILETARSVTIVSAEDFNDRGALTLDDTVGYSAGVVSDTFGFSTRGDFIRVRGLKTPEYLDNIQVLHGSYNTTRSELYTLDQVEILKGPASVLYGQGSPGGILNAISKRAGNDYQEKELVLSLGTFNRKQVAADLGFDLSGDGSVTGRVAGLFRDSNTQVNFVEDNSIAISPSITYENDITRLTAMVSYAKRESDTANQFVPLTISGCQSDQVTVSNPAICATAAGPEVDASFYAGDPNFNVYDTESTSLTLFAEHLINDIFSFDATARHREGEAEYRQALIASQGGNPSTFPDGTAAGRSWYDRPATSDQLALDVRLRANFDTGPASHDILMGINYHSVDTSINGASLLWPTPAAAAQIFPIGFPTTFNAYAPNYDGSEIPTAAEFDAQRTPTEDNIDTRAVYISDQVIWGNLTVNAGVRYDNIESSDGTTIQKDHATTVSFGALYKTDMGLYPYISYAESFTAVFGSTAFIPSGPPSGALKPEEGEQIEVGIKYQPTGAPAYITVALFDLEHRNLADLLAFPGTARTQNGVANIKGLEVEAMTRFGDMQLLASFSVLDTENQIGTVVDFIPEEQASLWALWAPKGGEYSGLRIGSGVRYAGETQSNANVYYPAGLGAGTLENATTDGYTVVDALIGYDFGKVSLALNVRNLFNHQYYGACVVNAGCFSGEVRTTVGTMTIKF